MGESVSFAFYARLVKNLRAVILFNFQDKTAIHRIEWLKKRFHYRNLGVPPSIYTDELSKGSGKDIFRKLYYPLKELKDLAGMIADLGYPKIFAETFILSSAYISPLFILSDDYLDLIERYSLDKVLICRELDIKNWKLHMRIANYSILDFYEDMVLLSMKYIDLVMDQENREKILDNRMGIVEKDKKRYWRIICGNNGSNVFLYYLDPLMLLEEKIDKIKTNLQIEYAPGLSVIPAVNLLLINHKAYSSSI